MSAGTRIAFSTLAFPDASLATALSLGRAWGYGGVELRLIDDELIDPSMPAEARAEVRRAADKAGLPIVAVDSSVRLTGEDPGAARGRSAGARGERAGRGPAGRRDRSRDARRVLGLVGPG